VVTRAAAYNCGQLCITCEGEPVRVSMCRSLECQRRTEADLAIRPGFQRLI
jgi:hypothetical protein